MNWKARLREYLVFSRSEKRGILLWLILMVFIILLPLLCRKLHPGFQPGTEEWAGLVRAFENQPDSGQVLSESVPPGLERYDTIRLFRFDPNHLGYRDWLALGLTTRQARTAVNYLKSGGVFRQADDLRKIYGLEEGQYGILEPYIEIASSETGRESDWEREDAPAVSQTPPAEVLEINSADSFLLQFLPGLGPVLASRLVRYRELLGGFYSLGQLGEVYGLDTALVSGWGDRVVLDTCRLRKIDLNRAGFSQLYRHPYIDYHQAVSLIRYREKAGAFHSLEEIGKNRLLPDSVFVKLRPYLGFNTSR